LVGRGEVFARKSAGMEGKKEGKIHCREYVDGAPLSGFALAAFEGPFNLWRVLPEENHGRRGRSREV